VQAWLKRREAAADETIKAEVALYSHEASYAPEVKELGGKTKAGSDR
jgi:hypothetical protein